MEAKKILVPSNWSDVTLSQFDQLLEISNNKELSIAEREIKLISVLTKLSVQDTRNLDAASFQQISNSLGFLNTKVEKSMPKEKFELNNKVYHADLYPKNFSAGQFLDYKVLAREDIDKKTARLIACFVYPEGARYNDGSYDVEDVVNDINEYMSVPEVTGFTDFFTVQYTAYAKALLEYSKRQIKKSKAISKQDKKKILEQMNKSKALINGIGTLE